MRRALPAGLAALLPLAAAAQMPSAALLETPPAAALPDAADLRPHDDWRVSCTGQGCTAAPAIQSPPLLLLVVPENEGPVLVLRAPLGLLLGEGAAIAVDGRPLGRLAFMTCESDGCVAPVRLDGALGAALRAGGKLDVTVLTRNGDPIAAAYSLMGFTAATADLAPAPPAPEEPEEPAGN